MKQLTNRKRILLLVPAALILFLALIETGMVNTELFKSRIRSSIKTSWKNMALGDTTEYPNEEMARKRAYLNNNNRENVLFRNATIIAEYEDQKFTIKVDEVDKEDTITVQLSTFNSGVIWTPFIKRTSFNASAEITQSMGNHKAIGNRVGSKLYTLKGKVDITGKFSVIGLCSYKHAKKLLLDNILQNLAESVRQEVLNTANW